jgi:acyl-CoA:6-aminopenicillanic acid acyl transferase
MKLTRRRIALLLTVLILVPLALSATCCSYVGAFRARMRIKDKLFTEREYPPARVEVQDNIPVLHIYGTPEEMGTQYGTLMKGALQALHTYMISLLPEKYLERMRDFARRAEPALPAAIRVELKAIAAAAEMPYLDLVTINVIPRLSCSALAVRGNVTGGPMLVGRNAEYPSLGLSDRGSLMVVRHPKSGRATLSISFLGMAGAFTGVNEDGVTYANLLVFNAREDGVRLDALPIQLALRVAGERSTTTNAMIKAVRGQAHMIPMNVMVADAKSAAVIELGHSAQAVRIGEGNTLAASNFFVTPGLCSKEVNCPRRAGLLKAAKDKAGKFDVEAMKEALHAARLKDINLQAVVFEPAAMKMHLSINRIPASGGPYTTFDLRKLFARKPVRFVTLED